MTAFNFLRMVLWSLVVLEVTTAIVAGLVPVSPGERALAGDIVFNCTAAALIAGAMLVLVHFVARRSNG